MYTFLTQDLYITAKEGESMIIKGKQNIIKAGTYKMVTPEKEEEAKLLESIIIPTQSNVDSLLGKMAEDGENNLSQAER